MSSSPEPAISLRVLDAIVEKTIRSRLTTFASEIGAHGVTLWITRGAELIACCNPLETKMLGIRQSLKRGIISQVYLTGMGIIEHTPKENPSFDATVDRLVGTQTHEIMAVPVDLGADGDGVISAVRLGEAGSTGFSPDDLAAMATLALELGMLRAR